MDPITLNKLLSVADAIETQREESQLPLDTFRHIIASQGQVKRLERRVRDILRVIEATGWITPERDPLYLTEDFQDFIFAWDSEEHLLLMNQCLKNYPPYGRFLYCLRHEKSIKVPQRQDRDSQRRLGRTFKEKYDITFVAFDTLQTWAVSVGHAYRSPYKRILYWGGDWDAKRPSLKDFRAICKESYCQTDKTSGYANLGRLAHLVCRKLSISFQAFEIKMNQFVETFPGEITLAPATMRREVSEYSKITSIRPRKEIIRERLTPKQPGRKLPPPKWLEHRYIEDGVRVKGKLVKLIRWEVSK